MYMQHMYVHVLHVMLHWNIILYYLTGLNSQILSTHTVQLWQTLITHTIHIYCSLHPSPSFSQGNHPAHSSSSSSTGCFNDTQVRHFQQSLYYAKILHSTACHAARLPLLLITTPFQNTLDRNVTTCKNTQKSLTMSSYHHYQQNSATYMYMYATVIILYESPMTHVTREFW